MFRRALVAALPCAAFAAAPVPPEKVNPRDVVTNTIGMKLALLPAGKFEMGSPDADADAQPDEKPRHAVRLTKPFFVGVTEVTVGEYKAFVKDTGYKTQAEQTGGAWRTIRPDGKIEAGKAGHHWKDPGFPVTDDHPAMNLNYDDAEAFCAWLSKKEKKTYRLPTEAEWEYACRAGTTTRWSCGDDKDALADVAQIQLDSFPKYARSNGPRGQNEGWLFMAPVRTHKPNPWGLYDVHGNVWEWCRDWYDEKAYADSPAADPTGPAEGSLRVIRGGTWSRGPLDCRSANRFGLSGATSLWVGFRVVRETDE